MNLGKNTPSSAQLRSSVERVERIREAKKALADDEKLVMAEAKSAGFVPAGIRYCLKVRAMKPHDRQEAEAIADLYLHALGMDAPPPLFRQLGALAKDGTAREQLIEAFKALVPQEGEVIVKAGGQPLRLWRDKDGAAHVEDWIEPAAAEQQPRRSPSTAAAPKREVPSCSPDEAEGLGRQAAKDNLPVIDNPFPHDDARRPRWDLGWRKETGNDGMNPDE